MNCSNFEQQDFGSYLTHFANHLDALRSWNRRAMTAFTACPLYMEFMTMGHLPGSGSGTGRRSITSLIEQARRVTNDKGAPVLAEFIEALLTCRSSQPCLRYFTVPVVVTDQKGQSRGGATYVKVQPNTDGQRLPNARGSVAYAKMIAGEVLKSIYLTNIPVSALGQLMTHQYEFMHEINDGNSFGAALACAMFLAHLEAKLDYRPEHCVAPAYGAAITGEVRSDGAIVGVSGIVTKVRYLLDEYGHSLRIFAPEANRVELVKANVDVQSVTFVNTVDELLAGVFDSTTTHHGLAHARDLLVQALSPSEKQLCKLNARHTIDPDYFDEPGVAAERLVEQDGLWVRFKAWECSMQLELAVNREGIAAADGSSRDVFLVLDGGEHARDLWNVPEGGEVSLITELVYEVRNSDAIPRRVWCAFLGSSKILPVGKEAIVFDKVIRRLRADEKLTCRGPYFRPTREALTQFSERRAGARVWLLSDVAVPDRDDLPDIPIAQIPVTPMKRATGGWDIAAVRERLQLNSALLSQVAVHFTEDLPIDWSEGEMTINDKDRGYRVTIAGEKEVVRCHLRFARRFPRQFRIEGQLSGKPFERVQTVLVTRRGDPWSSQVTEGVLSASEESEWQRGAPLLVRPASSFGPMPAFESIRKRVGDRSGWLVMREQDARWVFFEKSCSWQGRDDASTFVATRSGPIAYSREQTPERLNRSADSETYVYGQYRLGSI